MSKQKLIRFLWWFLALGFFIALLGASSAAILYAIFQKDVPKVMKAQDYRPAIKSKVFAQNGEIIAEFGLHERIVIPKGQMPKMLEEAFVAAEDKNFYHHYGIDFSQMFKAVVQSISGKRASLRGASTLTQQLAKSLLIKEEGYEQATARTISRKIKEAILARRLEQNLSKDEILWMYLNEVYLGQSSYGVAAAARTYFHKKLNSLTLGEVAIIAGLPQAPSRFSPATNMDKALVRQAYVLKRMLDDNYINKQQYDEALANNKNLVVFDKENSFRKAAPYVAEYIRLQLIKVYGEDRLYNDGLNIYTTIDMDHQKVMQHALQQGLMKIDKRQGNFRAIFSPTDAKDKAKAKSLLAKIDAQKKLGLPNNFFLAMVDHVQENREISVLVHDQAHSLGWLPGFTSLKSGDVVLVRKNGEQFFYEQEPLVEGAMFAIEPSSGYLTSMSGGYSFDRSEFNRVIKACRQPGSLFKPIVYSAAIALKQYTPATMIMDAPLTFYNGDDGSWKPKNLGNNYKGEVTMREALMNSMNVPTLNIMSDVGTKNVLDFAKRLGIQTPLKAELGTAIGSSCVTPWELAQVFLSIANRGEVVEPILIKEVTDRDHKRLSFKASGLDPWISRSDNFSMALNEFVTQKPRVMSEEDAYTMHYLLTEVVKNGTAQRARELGRFLAGKTGTTNDSFDTWFLGYTKTLLSAVWVGYDQMDTSLAAHEQGGRTALPLFLDFMKGALNYLPNEDWSMPSSMCLANIDKNSGLRVSSNYPLSFLAPFRCGLEPQLMDLVPKQNLEQAMDIQGM